ncbi:GCN5-related N-acetyltransferase [Rhodococcus sp. AW25M09]|nr:GCN5-related N-acetyltransferase [Rhodococcus sp. AW25M09]
MTGVLLRPAVRSDADFLFSMASDPEVVRWVGSRKPWSREYFDRRFAQALSATGSHEPDLPRWFIGTTEDSQPVGLLSLVRRSDHHEVGYWVHPDHWGHGCAGELVIHALDHAADLPLAAQVYHANGASRRVLERAGFTLVDDGEPMTYRRRIGSPLPDRAGTNGGVAGRDAAHHGTHQKLVRKPHVDGTDRL